MDGLFDVLNDADNLPIQDLMVDDKNDRVDVYLVDGTRFSFHIKNVKNGAFMRYNIKKFILWEE